MGRHDKCGHPALRARVSADLFCLYTNRGVAPQSFGIECDEGSMNGHHLILGEITDFVTGATVPDTHDERYRQKIARTLVERKGYPKESILPRRQLTVAVDSKKATVPITFIIRVKEDIAMIVHYGPGSLVTRHRSALAMGRLVAPYQIPVVVVTNGEQADILDGRTGRITAKGLDNLPDYHHLASLAAKECRQDVPPRKKKMEARIVMAFEVDDRCPCDTDVCRIGADS